MALVLVGVEVLKIKKETLGSRHCEYDNRCVRASRLFVGPGGVARGCVGPGVACGACGNEQL